MKKRLNPINSLSFLCFSTCLILLISYTTYPNNEPEIYDVILDEIEIVDNKVHWVYATAYHPVKEQTDNMPLITADGSRINPLNPKEHKWIGISQDLLKYFNYGDTVLVRNAGKEFDGVWIIHDCMNKKWKKRIDFLVGKQDGLISKDSVIIEKIKNK